MALPTELEVLKAAREQIAKVGYTRSNYIAVTNGEEAGAETMVQLERLLARASKIHPTAHVTTCAVGGIEHAIWKLSQVDVTGPGRNNRRIAQYVGVGDLGGFSLEKPKKTRPEVTLYFDVMERLNKIARQTPTGLSARSLSGTTWKNFEAPNIQMVDPKESKRVVLGIIDKAIRQVQREKKKKIAVYL